MNPLYEQFNNLVDKLEIHETVKGTLSVPCYELRVTAKEGKLTELIRFCAGSKWDEEYEKAYGFCKRLKAALKSKRPDPKYIQYLDRTSVLVHPKLNVITYSNGGLHHFCQHCFDIFPIEIQTALMTWYPKDAIMELGYFYSKPTRRETPKPILFTSADINAGFMADDRQFNKDLGVFLKYRKEQEV